MWRTLGLSPLAHRERRADFRFHGIQCQEAEEDSREPLGVAGSSDFGKALELYIFMELVAWRSYRAFGAEIAFWRTVNDRELAVDVKASHQVHEGGIRWLRHLCEDGPVLRRVGVSLEREPRKVSDAYWAAEILPWRSFFESLWGGLLL